YAAQVSLTETSAKGLDEAFSRALAAVLIKLTGQRSLPADPVVGEMIGKAAPLVSQYQVADGGTLRVQFDRQALRRRMDAANLPVWPDERPATLIVLVDPAAPADAARVPAPDAPVTDAQLVLDTASSRGLPVALLEAPDGAAGAAGDSLQLAQAEAARVGADLVLIGRRAPVSGSAAWRWTLQDGAERSEWQGDATQGVHRLADQLAARYAVAAAASSRLRLEVQGVGSFADYGRLQDYLRSVGVIESLAMSSLRGDSIVYELVVRGSADQLRDALALKTVLLPVAPADGVAVSTADLVYRISSAP
ncbi:MAG: uncharacterized protein QG595_1597, partial [Pseudomonadota bacterium]|nr:uncharacterized protein [Pseudomonadota bacterium]